MKRHTVIASVVGTLLVAGLVPAAVAFNSGGSTDLPEAKHLESAIDTAPERPQTAERPQATERPQRPQPTERPATEARPRPTEEPREELRLACEGIQRGERHGIACRWQPTRHPDFAAYMLWRGDGHQREVVYRTGDRTQTAFFDMNVRPGQVYVYAVHATDAERSVIAQGGPVRAMVQAEARPRREELRLACEGTERDGTPGIACRWSESRHPDFAGYLLWRGDGEQREVVFRTDDRTQTAHFDTKVRPGQPYVYVVHGVDADGNVVAQGGPVRARTAGQPQLRDGGSADGEVGSR